jgi:hypothetical protein
MKLRIWPLVTSTPSIPCLQYVSRLLLFYHCLSHNCQIVFLSGSPVSCFSPHLLEGGPLQDVRVDAASEAPEAEDNQDGDEGKDLLEGTSSTTSPPPVLFEDLGIDKKRKCVEELASSSASIHKTMAEETLVVEDEQELFDALDS